MIANQKSEPLLTEVLVELTQIAAHLTDDAEDLAEPILAVNNDINLSPALNNAIDQSAVESYTNE